MERLPEVQASWAAFVELRGRASFIVGEGFLSWQGKAAWAPKSRVSSISEEPAPFQIVLGARNSLTILMISSMAGVYGFGGEAVYCMTKFAQVGFAQALDKELRSSGIKVGAICPGGVKTEFALGKGRTEQSVAHSEMLDPEDVAAAILLACTQSAKSRIIEIRMRTMAEALA